MTMIKQLLKMKGRGCITIGPDQTVYSAIEKMAENNIGSVLVMDGATLVGVFTERDYARNVVLKGRSSPQTSSETSCQRKSCASNWMTRLRTAWRS